MLHSIDRVTPPRALATVSTLALTLAAALALAADSHADDWPGFRGRRGAGEDLAVAGDLAGVGNDQPMRRAEGTDLFYLSVRLEPNARLSYAFMRDFEKISDPLNPRTTTLSFFNEDMEMAMGDMKTQVSWFAMRGWKRPSFLDEPDGTDWPSWRNRTGALFEAIFPIRKQDGGQRK